MLVSALLIVVVIVFEGTFLSRAVFIHKKFANHLKASYEGKIYLNDTTLCKKESSERILGSKYLSRSHSIRVDFWENFDALEVKEGEVTFKRWLQLEKLVFEKSSRKNLNLFAL